MVSLRSPIKILIEGLLWGSELGQVPLSRAHRHGEDTDPACTHIRPEEVGHEMILKTTAAISRSDWRLPHQLEKNRISRAENRFPCMHIKLTSCLTKTTST